MFEIGKPYLFTLRETGSGKNDRGVMTLPLVCNMQQIDAFAEDKFTIKV